MLVNEHSGKNLHSQQSDSKGYNLVSTARSAWDGASSFSCWRFGLCWSSPRSKWPSTSRRWALCWTLTGRWTSRTDELKMRHGSECSRRWIPHTGHTTLCWLTSLEGKYWLVGYRVHLDDWQGYGQHHNPSHHRHQDYGNNPECMKWCLCLYPN